MRLPPTFRPAAEIAASRGAFPAATSPCSPNCWRRRNIPASMRPMQAIGPDTIAKFLLHLGLDRQSQGGHQHPADDLRQSGDAARDAGVPEGRAARDRRLAAVEPHLRRQPQYRADAVQRRLDVSGRGQADARRHRGDRAQSSRDFADGLFQRAEGLRIAAALSARRQGAARKILPSAARDVLLAAPRCRRSSGTVSTNSPCRKPAIAFRC